jgi:hypothetical protein
MTDLDRETRAAVDALAYRIRERDAAIRAGEDVPDADVMAGEFLTKFRAQGWRPTEAKVTPLGRTARPGSGSGPGEEYRRIRAEWESREHPHRTADPEGVA